MDDKTWELTKTIGQWLSGGAIGAVITLSVTWLRGRRQRILVRKTVTYMDVSNIRGNYKTEIVFKPKEEKETLVEYTVDVLAILKIEFKNPSNKDFKEFTAQVNIDKMHRIIAVEHKGDDTLHIVDTNTKVSITEPTDEYRFNLKLFNRSIYTITFIIDAKNRKVLNSLQIGRDQAVRFVNADFVNLIVSMICIIFSFVSIVVGTLHSTPAVKNPSDSFTIVSLIVSFLFMIIAFAKMKFSKKILSGIKDSD